MSKLKFYPEEVLFAPGTQCNLHCPHCFVTRNNEVLNSQDAINFLESCKGTTIRRIGFTGGEPFLYTDFLVDVIKYAVSTSYTFDHIQTNGVWWTSKDELNEKLNRVRDAGFDGKFGLSFDSFHGLKLAAIKDFCDAVFKIFDGTSIEIQSVISQFQIDIKNIEFLANYLKCKIEYDLDEETGVGTILIKNDTIFIPVYRQLQSFPSTDTRTWKAAKWFKDDYCEGPGQVLYVHSNGNIAPCCGFSNENEKLIIGNIKQDFDTVMHQASKNEMLKICYNDGLSSQIKAFKKAKIDFPGKTEDICAFCEFVCNHIKEK
ncbi:MAG: 4Fe-4S cluster-binding domain-containing protein [Treponema sp.]|nr:4Fe-4S cluster-binding domain-containing protein [Treponema sp.]